MLAAACIAMAGATLALAAPASAATTSWPHSLYASRTDRLYPGHLLVSANGRYHAAVQRDGRLTIHTAAGRRVWRSPAAGPAAHLTMARTGQALLVAARHVQWATGTWGSGSSNVLTMRDDGTLALTAGRALVWSSRTGNVCQRRSGKSFVVDLSRQLAGACSGTQQIRVTPITSGATALGAGTLTGTWRVQSRVRDTTLHPSSGGAYPVHYWMPYDGAYGIHDSPWQNFPYGSSLYRTRGSHGCIHVPGPTMAWLFHWAPVGTVVAIHA